MELKPRLPALERILTRRQTNKGESNVIRHMSRVTKWRRERATKYPEIHSEAKKKDLQRKKGTYMNISKMRQNEQEEQRSRWARWKREQRKTRKSNKHSVREMSTEERRKYNREKQRERRDIFKPTENCVR